MTTHYCDRRKIDPTRGALLGDGTLNDNDRVEIGPTQLAFGEWAAAGLALPNLERMREFRWKRLVKGVMDRGYGGILLFDPLNIRYAADFIPSRTPPAVDGNTVAQWNMTEGTGVTVDNAGERLDNLGLKVEVRR